MLISTPKVSPLLQSISLEPTTSRLSPPACEPVANLRTIRIEGMIGRDANAIDQLYQAAKNPGLFYVDLRTPEYQSVLANLEAVYRTSARYFAQDEEIKELDIRGSISERGYSTGNGYESFEIAHDKIANSSFALPRHLIFERERLICYMNKCQQITINILQALVDKLEKGAEIRFDESEPSYSSLKFISAPTYARREDAPDITQTTAA